MNRPETPRDRYAGVWLLLLCLLGTLHAVAYAISNPVFESPDEPGHLEYVNRIASGGKMPNQYAPKDFLAEGHQTPLYYLAVGTLLRIAGGPISVNLPPSHISDPAPVFDHRTSPFHSSRDRTIFYSLRLLGCAFVGVTVLQTGRAAKLVMPVGHVWMIAPMLVAMLPQFAFIGSSVSNDGLVTLMGACATLAAARCSIFPESKNNWLSFGVWIGLAFLAKKNALAYIPAALIFAVALQISRAAPVRIIWRNLCIASAAAFALLLPVLIRNFELYRELLGTQMEMDTMPNLAYPQAISSRHFRVIFPDIVPRSFVAHMGWMVVEVKQRFVWPIVRGIIGTSLLGLLELMDRQRAAFTAFCAAAFCANIVGLIYYNLMFPQAQGRLLFPTLAPLAILCALGLHAVSKHVRIRYKAIAIVPIFLALLWFDLLCFWTNQNFYAWFGAKLGL